ncbi:phosphoribosylglycinamide synthetase [Streptococcus thoraltensis]|uniref:phosphoribosylglycinamide synthetase n=1 Tax=Streptococcus thoraltensis TaxID=55085 RepID=UPI001F59892E|nr:phosphoribosylglycinamide synthetase [Streptococcus thoraltensis]
MKIIWKILNSKVPLWCLLVVLLFAAGSYVKGYIQNSNKVEKSYSMITSLEKAEEVVFLNAGIQTVETESDDTELFDAIKVPFSKKKAIIILNYKAKFGIKKPVKINKKADNTYQIIVPKFEFIGHELNDKNGYEVYDKSGELLSIGTNDIDTGSIVTKSLSSKKQKKYLKDYNALIKESAKDYYNNLFKMIDPEAKLEFIFQ